MLDKLLVVHPHLNVRGGSERLTKILVEQASRMGIEVHVVTGALDEEWFKGVEAEFHVYRGGSDFLAYVSEVASQVRAPAAYIALQESYYAYAVKRGCKETFTAMYIHFPYDEEVEERNLEDYAKLYRYPHLASRYLDSVDAFMANSRRTALITRLVWGVEPEVIYPCIDENFFAQEPPLGKEREPLIFYLGRLCPLKRHDFLLLVFDKILEKVPDARLVIAGFKDPRNLDYYEHMVKLASRVKGAEIIVSPGEEELLKLYREARVYAHPRIGEHFGMAPVEAMSQGTPIVVRAPTGLAEVIEPGKEGYAAWSDYEFLEKVVEVLSKPFEEWKEMQRAAYRRAQEFKPRKFAQRILHFIEESMKRRKPR